MPLKNQAVNVTYYAWNTSTNTWQTGDVANHTIKLVQDGTEASATNSPTQIDATNFPGAYNLALTAGDVNFNSIAVGGKSSTANVVLFGGTILTDRGVLPSATPGSASGLILFGTGTGQLNPSSGGVDIQTIKAQTITCAAGVTVGAFVGNATHALTVDSSGDVTFNNTSIATVTTVTNQLTAAAIATGVWQDSTAGDFTAASSVGKSLYTSGAAPGASGGLQINGTNLGSVAYTSGIATNITGNLSGSVGSVTGNVGGSVGSVTGAVGNVTGNVGGSVVGSTASVTGAVGTVTAPVTISLTQSLAAARALDAIADTSLTLNDALHCAIAGAVGKESVTGTTYLIETPSTGTTLRTFTLDSGTTPTTRS